MTNRVLEVNSGPSFAGWDEMHMDLDSKGPRNQISAFAAKCNWEIASIYAFQLFSDKICKRSHKVTANVESQLICIH